MKKVFFVVAAALLFCAGGRALAQSGDFEITDGVLVKYRGNATEVRVPDGVTGIGNRAVSSSKLVSITIPASVTSIGDDPFPDCWNLTAIRVDQGNPAYMDRAGVLFTKDLTALICYPGKKTASSYRVPAGIKTIGPNAFASCRSLVSITLPAGLAKIGHHAFSYCSLTSMTIPESVTSIGGYAFYGCKDLAEIVLPAGLTEIEMYTFYECAKLARITIPAGVREIEYGAFYGCDSLPSAVVTAIRDKFGGLPFAVGR
ncbi:MAG: leucine-rich repeat domain-containing protein [Treponema sp.]|nr:leucine-rich repeat domain-containing protein [Treponema sp.]